MFWTSDIAAENFKFFLLLCIINIQHGFFFCTFLRIYFFLKNMFYFFAAIIYNNNFLWSVSTFHLTKCWSVNKRGLKDFITPDPLRSFTVKENHIGSAVNQIFRYTQTYMDILSLLIRTSGYALEASRGTWGGGS